MNSTISILHADGISAAGFTVPEAVDAIYRAEQPFQLPNHFRCRDLLVGVIPELSPEPGESRAISLLKMLCKRLPAIPKDTHLYVATTVGAIDCLEKKTDTLPDCTQILLEEACRLTGGLQATLVSAACASGQTAIAMASRALALGQCTYALILGLDIASHFVTIGFASLRACAKGAAHPYDANRDGMLLGEGAGALLLTSRQDVDSLGTICAAFESCDASHITAPDASGKSLSQLMRRTLDECKLTPEDIGGIIGHGTGTLFNDASELSAISQTFHTSVPLLSIKGMTGHTLGATGVLQVVYGLQFLKRGMMPPQAGLKTPDPLAKNHISNLPQPLKSRLLLSLNVGFGGINSALVFTDDTTSPRIFPIPGQKQGSIRLLGTATIDASKGIATNGKNTFAFETLSQLKQQLETTPGIIQGDLSDFRRAADNVRLAQLCAILCASAQPDWSAEHTALIGCNGDGCRRNNADFWNDVASHGFENGRASLFVPTLPSIPVCEAAITLGIRGPVRYLKTFDPEQVLRHLQNIADTDTQIQQFLTIEIADSSATTRLYQV